MIRPIHCSLYLFCSQEKKEKFISRFSFSLKHYLATFLVSSLLLLVCGLPGGANGKESSCQCRRLRRHKFNPWVGKICWRKKWQPTAAFLPGKSHGQRSLTGYSPWGCKELDTTESVCTCAHARTHTHTHTNIHTHTHTHTDTHTHTHTHTLLLTSPECPSPWGPCPCPPPFFPQMF